MSTPPLPRPKTTRPLSPLRSHARTSCEASWCLPSTPPTNRMPSSASVAQTRCSVWRRWSASTGEYAGNALIAWSGLVSPAELRLSIIVLVSSGFGGGGSPTAKIVWGVTTDRGGFCYKL
eukprot:scaffold27358_cov48-Phaeocystis_antarctica.AAC.1